MDDRGKIARGTQHENFTGVSGIKANVWLVDWTYVRLRATMTF
jgi:hypothetical protein